MPVFNNPRQAIITEGGGGVSDLLGILAMLTIVALVIGGIVLFIAEHLVLIAVYAGILAAVGTAGFCILRRFMMVVHEPAPALPLAVQATLGAPPRRAIAPVVQHQHLHLHGLTGDEIAAIVSQVTNVPPDAVRTSLHALPTTPTHP